jgi:hypothetical protein
MEFSYKLVQSAEFSKSVRRFNLLSSLAGTLQNRRAKGVASNDIETAINSAASTIASKVEQYTAKSLGMSIVPTLSGFGASPDLVSSNPKGISLVAEIKAIVPEFSSSALEKLKTGTSLKGSTRKGIIGFSGGIKITTTGVGIKAGAPTSLTVGFRGKNQLTKTFNNDTADKFYATYSNNLALLKSHLDNPSSADPLLKPFVKALRLNLFLKAKSVFIPVAINNSTVLIGNLTFKSKELFSSANSFVDLKFSNDKILVNLKIPDSVLNKAFREASDNIFDDILSSNLLNSVESFMESNIKQKSTTLAKDYAQATLDVFKILKRYKISVGANYAKGSVIASSINISYPKAKKEPSQLSIIDITTLVRGRTRLKMRRGQGNPTPPNIYERSGTFRSSIEAVANMNSRIIDYFYLPYYSSLEKYGYQVDDLVERSIRDIAKERLGQDFILRKNTQSII